MDFDIYLSHIIKKYEAICVIVYHMVKNMFLVHKLKNFYAETGTNLYH